MKRSTFVLILAFAVSCTTRHRLAQSDRTGCEACMINMLRWYADLDEQARLGIHPLPANVSAKNARSLGWVCVSGKLPFEFITPASNAPPVFVDPNPHISGYVVVYGRDKVAIVPDDSFDRFMSALKKGRVELRSAWITRGDSLWWGPGGRPLGR